MSETLVQEWEQLPQNAGGAEVLPMNWDAAKKHFDEARKVYQDMEGMPGVNTTLALRAVFDPLSHRYNNGERTQELYDEMMSVE